MKRRNILKAFAAVGTAATIPSYCYAQLQPIDVPGDGIVFDNEKVRVYRRSASPGQDVYRPASLNRPWLALYMTDANLKTTVAGRENRFDYKQGALVWSASEMGAVENVGAFATTVYLIEPKGNAPSEHQTQEKPPKPEAGGKIVLENDRVRVIEHSARPRMGVCGMGMHTHPPHLTIGLNEGRVKLIVPNKEPVIRDVKAGRIFWDDGGPHANQNVGSRSTRIFLIEIKGT